MKQYEYFDHTADVLFEAWGDTPAKMFEAAAEALTDLQVKIETIKTSQKKTISVSAPTLEKLLFEFLEELVFVKDADYLILKNFSVSITETDKGFSLECIATGEPLNMDTQEMLVDAKAITYHQFEVWEAEGGWRCRVIVDI